MPDHRPLIFISYRGSVENWATELVYARLTGAFGADAVFKAGNSIQAGERFPQILRRQAASCPVMLVCIGAGWLTAGPPGARRLDSPQDWVRQEIAISLAAENHVIPLLIGNLDEVGIPAAEDLPEDIRALTYCQAVRLVPGGGLDLTMPKLVDELARLAPELGERGRAPEPEPGATQHAALAERGASHLVAAMATERWAVARDAAQRMFALIEPTRCTALVGQLDQDKSALGALGADSDDRQRERIALRWEGRLEELLARHPAMRQQFADLVAQLQALVAQPDNAGGVVNRQRIEARGSGATAVGAQNGNVYYYGAPPPQHPSTPAPTASPPVEEPAD